MGRIAIAIVTLTALMLARPARATTVAIVRPEGSSPIIAETLVRLEGELRSVGFETAIVDVQREREGRRSAVGLDQIGSRWRVDAVVAVLAAGASDSVDIWVVDRSNGRTLERTATVERGLEHTSQTLAIRALELLRSSLLELDLSLPAGLLRAPATPAPPTAQAAPATPATPTAQVAPAALGPVRMDAAPEVAAGGVRGRVGLEVGGAVVAGTGGVGTAFAPFVRIDWAPQPKWAATLAVAGLGTQPTVRSPAGSADVSRDSALVGVTRRFRADRRVRPLVSLGAGALHTSVDGRADAPNQGHRLTRWSLLLEAALGAELRVDDRFFLVGAAHVQLAEPYVAVRLLDDDAATLGRPDLLLTLSVGAWL